MNEQSKENDLGLGNAIRKTTLTGNGRICQHGRFQPYCKQCKGSMLCMHLRHKNRCALCRRCSAYVLNAAAAVCFLQ